MFVNADFQRRASVTPDQYRWLASPQAGVERMMLDRIGEEKARATSLVRYAPGSVFPRHQHPGGEEILVLSGVFSDENGDYPAGWYLRNPPGSSHKPSSAEGTVIFVKLWQMAPDDRHQVRIDTRAPSAWESQANRRICRLFSTPDERVSIERLAADMPVFDGSHGPHPPSGGAEILVLDGSLVEGAGRYERGSWLRLPPGQPSAISAGSAGASVYLKTGHLVDTAMPPF